MASKGPPESSFESQFQEFTFYRTYFEGCLKESKEILKELKETFKDDGVGEKESSNVFLTEREEQQLGASLAKKSTILVVGQTNSGKSSLLNELLGGTFLPTHENPCTSRIVRLKYSEHNYVQLLDKAGNKIGKAQSFTKKRIPKDEIDLEDKKRSSEECVSQIVEVGLDNSLLQHGHLEFVDAPGMSENDSLDDIVQECLDGVLQVIIYVIDGNSSLRTQERDFLYKLKEKMGFLPIFFVCNKIDRNQKAEEFDRDSDDGDKESQEAAVKRIIQEKTQLSYTSLVQNGLLQKDVEPEDCGVYHGVSSKEVRKARRNGVTNQYTKGFERMKNKLLKFAASSICSHLRSVADQLRQVQQRVFHFALSRVLKRDDPRNVEMILGELKSKEREYNKKAANYVRDNEATIANLISTEVKNNTENILVAAESMEFAPIQCGDVIGMNEVVHQCRNQIQTLVLMHVMNIAQRKGKDTVMTITRNVRASLEKLFAEVSKDNNMVDNIVKNQLLNCTQLKYCPPNYNLWQFDDFLMTAWYKNVLKIYVLQELISIVKGTIINKEWKKKIAKDVIDNIDYEKLARRTFHGIYTELQISHSVFMSNIKIIQVLCNTARKQSTEQRDFAVFKAPSFAEQMCKTEALLQTLSASRVQLGSEIKTGHRGVVYECSVHAMGEVVAKQFNLTGGSYKSEYLAVQYTMRRAEDDYRNILKPMSLRLDFKNNVTILLPKMDVSLYDALAAGRIKCMGQSSRLAIVLQMTDACRFSRHCGLYHVDPRITNILLDERNMSKLNVCKTRDDNVPYPDNKAPFHVPQEKPADHASDSYLGHDLYSLGVLLWLLLNGEYCRPKYADTTEVEEVYSAVASGRKLDVSCLVDMQHNSDLQELLELAWLGWSKEIADISKFQERLDALHSRIDSQTDEAGFDQEDPAESEAPSLNRSYITHFESCVKESLALLETMKEALKHEESFKMSNIFMTDKEEKQLGSKFAKTSTVLVVGQTNSGKTSFLNELLGGTYLPTAEISCTSRIVRLKYSKHNYLQLLDKAGNKVGEAKSFTRNDISKDDIVLEDMSRSSEEWVEQLVEVGIKNSFLQNGHLEFVDIPSMGVNKALDNIVQECLDKVQVVLYMIDGNSFLRAQERIFLHKVKERMCHLPTFFVCNKVDIIQTAEDSDRDSDDEDENEAERRAIQKNTQLSYTRLVRNGLVSEGEKPEDCHVYHAVSAKEVRKARREHVTNQYTEEFEKMKSKLLKLAMENHSSQLGARADLLSQIQQRVFEFFVSHCSKRDTFEETGTDIVDVIRRLRNAERMQSILKHMLVAHFPAFAEQMCKTEALLQSLSSSTVQLGREIRRGHRGVVFECSVYGMGEVAAKQLRFSGESSKSQYLAIQFAMRRVGDDCKSILKPVSLRLDYNNNVTILFPKMDMSLYDALVAGRVRGMGLGARLAIVLQVTDACNFSRRFGLYHVDPRITNVLLDKQNVAKLNVCKTRDDHVSYPDDKAPFHVPQEKPADHASESYLGHDLYSLGVLLWLLLNGEYCRPKYAETTDVKEVYFTIASGMMPEVPGLIGLKDCDAPQGLLKFAWTAWRKNSVDLRKFQAGLNALCSQSDLQTVSPVDDWW